MKIRPQPPSIMNGMFVLLFLPVLVLLTINDATTTITTPTTPSTGTSTSSIFYVTAFPTGAADCIGGKAAVGGFHYYSSIDRPVKKLTLTSANVTVTVGNTTLKRNQTNTFKKGIQYEMNVQAKNMRGLLLRMEAPKFVKTNGVLSPGLNTQNAIVCESPIVGVTHTNSTFKDVASGKIRFDKSVTGVIIDLTIVFENNFTLSKFAYGRYKLNFWPLRNQSTPVSAPIVQRR